jgi:hypothetical protein
MPAIYMTMDLDVSLWNDEVLHVPTLNANSHPHLASLSLTSIIEEGYMWLDRRLLHDSPNRPSKPENGPHGPHTMPASWSLLLLPQPLPIAMQWFGMQ